MRSHSKSDLVALMCGLVLAGILPPARPAAADDIVALMDEQGRKVYINIGDPTGQNPSLRSRSGSLTLSPAEIHHLVAQAANRAAIDPQLVHAIIQIESDYNPGAVSAKGAMGLMQLVPSTAQRFGVANPFDPKQNIEGGVNYLKHLLDLFRGDLSLSLAAYNAGENSVLRQGGVPSIAETREYVQKVTSLYGGGPSAVPGKSKPREPQKAPIYRYVDAQGVVHFTNGDEL